MNQREVIAITVIINIVLLSVLFFTAQRLEQDIFEETVAAVNTAQPLPLPQEIIASPSPQTLTAQSDAPVDEVDTFLRDFAAAVAAHQQQQDQPAPPPAPVYKAPEPALPPAPVKIASLPQPPTIPMAQPAAKNMVEVVVKKGDFLQKIAKQNNSTVEAIKIANNMKSDQLKVGQVLRVPFIAAITNEKPQTVPAPLPGNSYKVKPGDSPWKIAKQHNVSLDELLKLNNLDEESAKNLKPGDTIRVP